MATGPGGDTHQARQALRDHAVNHKFVMGSEVSPKEVSLGLSAWLHELGMSYRRPLGVGIIVAGFDKHGTEPVIYHCDVDGNAIDRNGIALGRSAGEAEHALQEGFKAGVKDLEQLVRAAAEATVKGMKEDNADMAEAEFRVDVDVLSPGE